MDIEEIKKVALNKGDILIIKNAWMDVEEATSLQNHLDQRLGFPVVLMAIDGEADVSVVTPTQSVLVELQRRLDAITAEFAELKRSVFQRS